MGRSIQSCALLSAHNPFVQSSPGSLARAAQPAVMLGQDTVWEAATVQVRGHWKTKCFGLLAKSKTGIF